MRISLLAFLALFVLVGCKNLEPTVKELRNTVKDMRTRDYEKGRVVFSKDPLLGAKVLTTRIERLMDAENNAAVALGEDKPFPDVKKSAAEAVTKATDK